MKNKGCFIAFLISVAIMGVFAFAMVRALTPRDLSKEDPGQAFKSFVCSPLPKSVHEVHASGVVAFASANVCIDFEFDPRDHDDLVQRGKFKLADDKARQWIKEFQPEGVTGDLIRYIRINEGMAETALFVAPNRRRAWFREIQY